MGEERLKEKYFEDRGERWGLELSGEKSKHEEQGGEEGSPGEGDGKQTWGGPFPGFWPSSLGCCQERASGGGGKRETLLIWVFAMSRSPALWGLLWLISYMAHRWQSQD